MRAGIGTYYRVECSTGYMLFRPGRPPGIIFEWIASARTYRDAKSLIWPEGELTGVLKIRKIGPMPRDYIWLKRTWEPSGKGNGKAPMHILMVDANHFGTILCTDNAGKGMIIPFIGGDATLGTIRLGQWKPDHTEYCKRLLTYAAKRIMREAPDDPEMEKALLDIKQRHDPNSEILIWN